MGNLRILIPEIIGSKTGYTYSNNEASASLSAANMATDEPWQKWRSGSVLPNKTSALGSMLGNPATPIDGVAIAAASLLPGNGEILAILSSDINATVTPQLLYQEMVPTAIAASLNIAGVVGDVNEGSGATDSAFITPTAASSYVIFDFGTPAAAPRTGTKRSAIVLRVAASADTGGTTAWKRPTVTVSVYEDVLGTPTLRLALGTKAVSGTALHYIFFSFDPSILATPDGSKFQVRVDFGTESSSATIPKLDSIFWAPETNQLSGTVLAESGWQTILPEPTSGVGYDYVTELTEANTRWSHQFPSIYQAASVHIFVREDHVPAETATFRSRQFAEQPPGYIEIGKLCAGLWWSPAINRAQGQFVTVDDPSQKNDDEGGGEWGSAEEPRDSFKISLSQLTEQEAAWLNWRLLHEIGVLSPFYLELEPDATFELRFGGWVTLLSVSNPISRRNTDLYTYSMEFTVRVKR